MDDTVSYSTKDYGPPRLTILLVSALAISYEILLMRLFSIVQFHHFAYMVISLSLLGYGASGTFLVFCRQPLLRRFPAALIGSTFFLGITVVACFAGGQHLLFNPDQLLWDNRQWLKLFALYLLLALPFFCAANCIALSFSRYRERISEIYGADLFGAGLGSLLVIGLLFLLFPDRVLLFLGATGVAIGGAAWLELRLQPRWPALLFVGAAGLFFLLPSAWTVLAISPYKPLSQQLRIDGSRIVEVQSSPLGMLTVVESNEVPLRHAPGLSLAAAAVLPEQLGVFTDGGAMSVISRFPHETNGLAYLNMVPEALPYHLGRPEEILILGVAGGAAILQAIYFETPQITAVELNPRMIQLVRGRPQFSGQLFDRENVRVHQGEARSFVARSSKKFDLIQLPSAVSAGGSAAGLHALSENYLYTVEAFREYFDHLSPGGYLSVGSWVRVPPRDSLKLLATAAMALTAAGVQNAGDHLVMIRNWQNGFLLVGREPFSTAEILLVQDFCRKRLFDLAYYPGMKREEANRFHLLSQPYYYDGTLSLLGPESEDFAARYKFNIRPNTDDRPYFSNYFKWQTLPEILKLKDQGGLALLESGYLVLVLTLFQAVLAGLVLVFLPVAARLRSPDPATGWSRSRVAAYFFAIGLGFLFLEIAFIQKFILYLGHPLYAAAAVLALFLVFAGLGSRYAQAGGISIHHVAAAVIVIGIVDLAVVNLLFDVLARLNWFVRGFIAIAMLGPLAFSMGMPFPLALTAADKAAPDLVPWAWGVNGCASVIGAVLATLLAVHFGFTAVVLAALGLYGFAAAVFPAAKTENREKWRQIRYSG
jgi:spermidine synthase